ncbi:MAG: DUF4240 domain-containing protein [Promethearchaeota archaeon]|nr:MAG: DUF4240 domain-containing protein [Candidatus Lokiarchaeota archaeon]
MDVKTFWELIGESAGDGKRLATLLKEQKPEDVRGFGDILDLHFSKAFNWNLWAAAYLINGGCSEEEFDQFLYWLISLGEDTYEKALEDPDSLIDVVKEDTSTFNDDIIVAIARTLDKLGKDIEGKSNVTIPADLMQFQNKLRKPRGKEWNTDEELLEMFPKLGERFGEMLEDEEDDDDEDWNEEDKNKSKLRRAWDKFVEFFARIFDKFLSIFRKKKKGEDEEEEREEDPYRLVTKMGVNFWLYITFMVMFVGFLVLIPLTTLFQNLVAEKIAVYESFQAMDFSEIMYGWDYLTNQIIQRKINRLVDRLENWNTVRWIWVMGMILSLFAGLPLILLVLQERFIQLTPNSMEFLTKKEVVKQTIKIKEIESIHISRNNTIMIVPKKNSDADKKMMLELVSAKSLKKYCIEHKIPTEEDTHLVKMLLAQVSDKIKQFKNRK